MGKLTISMAMFNNFVSLPEGKFECKFQPTFFCVDSASLDQGTEKSTRWLIMSYHHIHVLSARKMNASFPSGLPIWMVRMSCQRSAMACSSVDMHSEWNSELLMVWDAIKRIHKLLDMKVICINIHTYTHTNMSIQVHIKYDYYVYVRRGSQ